MSDLALLEDAARTAGKYAHQWFGRPFKVTSKGAAGPVTEVDLAVDEMLHARLLGERPDYGWLSEESPDNPARLEHKRIFALDPIDGTRAFIDGTPEYSICIGVIEEGRAVAGAIYNPATDEMFLGAVGHGATLNGRTLHASSNAELEDARVIGKRGLYTHGPHWPRAWPDMRFTPVQSIAYRLAKVASGAADFTLLIGWKHEWDIAAGAAIVEAAGGRFTNPWGGAVAFNQPEPRTLGAVASGAALHPLIIERTSHFPRKAKDS